MTGDTAKLSGEKKELLECDFIERQQQPAKNVSYSQNSEISFSMEAQLVEAMSPMDLSEKNGEVNKNYEEQKSETKSIPKSSKKKFKDFTLDSKRLFTPVTDDELKEAFILKKSTSKPGPSNGRKVDNGGEGDFEIVEKEKEHSPFVTAAIEASQMTLTENLAPTFSTSADARVDFFFHVMEQTDSSQTKSFLEKSWRQDPLHTLKLVAILRDIRDGKGIRKQYHECLFWLYENHPKTLYENLEELLKFGYWKDILQLLMVVIFDGYVHPFLSRDDMGGPTQKDKPKVIGQRIGKRELDKKGIAHFEENATYNKLIAAHFGHSKTANDVSEDKTTMDAWRLQFAREKFANNVKYRVFHLKVAKVFAKQLQKDLITMKSETDGDKKKKKEGGKSGNSEVSLAGKWAPSIEAHFDRYTLISSTIAVELIKLLGDCKFDVLTKSIPVAVYLSRKCYHKEYCVPLRKFLEIAEVPMSAGQWSLVNYARVPSKCMKRNTKIFQEHDETRFSEYINRPKSKVAGATLKPVEILTTAMRFFSSNSGTDLERTVMEKQWLSLVEDIKKKGGGLLKNAVAVCDVSGSMSGDPILAALGLTLITMDMCEAPWNSICITFHESPTFHNLEARPTLMEKVKSLQHMQWGMNTNIQKVFDLILNLGLKKKLTQEQMPSILLIFTDMEFDSAFPRTTMTNFEAAKDRFTQKGYKLPSIVFWNLRAKTSATSTPVQVNEYGAILMSGFSGQQLQYVIKQDDLSKCTPLQFVLDIIEQEHYKNLAIYD